MGSRLLKWYELDNAKQTVAQFIHSELTIHMKDLFRAWVNQARTLHKRNTFLSSLSPPQRDYTEVCHCRGQERSPNLFENGEQRKGIALSVHGVAASNKCEDVFWHFVPFLCYAGCRL